MPYWGGVSGKIAFREAIGIKRFEYIATNEDKQNSAETKLSCDKITGRKAARSQLKWWNQGKKGR